MVKYFCRFWLTIWGFSITGDVRNDIKKKLYIVFPHTSNWDFVLGILVKGAISLDVNYIGKDSLFKFPFGWYFRWLGGIPVQRTKSTNFVDMMVGLYNKYDKLSFGMSPEGTRKKVEKFRSGFYYIALKAKIPIILVTFDFGTKIVHFGAPFEPTGDYQKDMKFIIQSFQGIKGYNQDLACDWSEEST